MSDKTQEQQNNAVQTTGHAWDGDLQEFNNPLPRWWIWTFYATIVFSLIYWVIFPTWPYANTYTKGIGNTITFENEQGEEVTTHWNTRSLLIEEMQTGEEALKQKAYLEKVNAASYEEILSDPDMMAFTNSTAKVLFADNCAACHGPAAALPGSAFGLYPNLADDAWLWGGSVEEIEQTLILGRNGYMPAFGTTLSEEQLDEVANYVLSLSMEGGDASKAAAGEKIFNGQAGGCHYCHTKEATGLKSQGAANLTDAIWTVANVPAAPTTEAKLVAIKQVIRDGINRVMPAWSGRLSDDEIKQLAIYVHQRGGGK
ncbi:MAG: cytochrome-c oxidase, cbb3-type subunit III [Chromatiales bacterium]|jgi:cytochrome c oxidase cbb3-type subunit 3